MFNEDVVSATVQVGVTLFDVSTVVLSALSIVVGLAVAVYERDMKQNSVTIEAQYFSLPTK